MTRTVVSSTRASDTAKTIKFLYSYGGKILPRRTDGKLRYVGGFTRILAVDHSITFAELMVKLGELCGSSMIVKCKLPNEDLDVLVSITCDEDLAHLIDEYDRHSAYTHKDTKITAVLFPLKSLKKISPVSSSEDLCSTGSSAGSSAAAAGSYPPVRAAAYSRMGGRCFSCNRLQHHHRCGVGASPRHTCFVPCGNYCR